MKVKVNTAGMVSIHSNQYSVPTTYIGKTVDYQIHDSNVYLYFNTKLIAMHALSERKLNYMPEHYSEVLSLKYIGMNSDEVRQMAEDNLRIIEVYIQVNNTAAYTRITDNLKFLKSKESLAVLDQTLDFVTKNNLSFIDGFQYFTEAQVEKKKLIL